MRSRHQQTNIKSIAKHVAVLRIAFGIIWAIDATFKWQPNFSATLLDQIKSAGDGQAQILMGWFDFWTHLLAINPPIFSVLIALVESVIALSLIFGFARRMTYLAAAIFSLLIWGVAEGFGGPYSSASVDIGTGLIYAVVFLALYGLDRLTFPGNWAIDNYVTRKIGWWDIVANP